MGLRYLGNIIKPGYNPLASNITTGVNTAQFQGVFTLQQQTQAQSTQRWVTDPLYRNTTLLLQADNAANGAQNNTFLDSSSNNFTITRNGNTTQGTFTPFSQSPGWWGNYFDGTGDFLTAVGANLALGTGDFTIEFWFYAAAYSSAVDSSFMFDSRSGNNTTGFFIGPVFNNTQTLNVGQNTTPILTANTTYPLNTWIHCAVVRSSGTITLYQNGVSVGSVANTTNNTATTNYIGSGWWQPSGSGQMFNGYLSNLRISNIARYTANFNPPTNIFVSDGNTRLLTCQANRFLDSSSNAYTVTSYGTPSVQAFSPFAPQYQYTPSVTGGSGYFDGTGDYLSIADNTAFQFGSGDFTIEAWVYRTASGVTQQIIGSHEDGVAASFLLYISSGNKLIMAVNNSIQAVSAGSVPVSAWTHVAGVRNGNTIYVYVNGVQDGSVAFSTSVNSNAYPITIAADQNGDESLYSGYIANLRIVKGTAVYTAGFTPPTSPVTAITNTSLLTNFTNAGIYDGTLKNNLETVGNAQVSTSVVKYGTGSMYFDGSGDYLTLSPSQSLNAGTGDFTVEMWVYPTSYSAATNYPLWDQRGTSVTSTGYYFGLTQTNGYPMVYLYPSIILTGSSGPALNTWSHIAFSRSNGTIRAFVNGIQVGSVSNSISVTDPGAYSTRISQSTVGATENYTGYIDDFRVTRGIARYTANFTPPTVALPRQ